MFEQENILGEDVLKLQNLICGGYIDDEETFLSLDKFIKKKDEFVLLNDLYDRTQKVGINKKISVKELSKRDMFSILYIKENMRNLNRSDIKYLSDKLKIVI